MMKEGMSYQEYFAKVQKLYEEAGYDGEWKLHHQGGPTGYACREFVVTPETGGEIHESEAFAWNPTIQGTKCEVNHISYGRRNRNLHQDKRLALP